MRVKKYSNYILGVKVGSQQFKKSVKTNIPRTKISKFLNVINKEIVKQVLDGRELKLPFSLGSLRVEKRKMSFKRKTRLSLDYKKWHETKKKVYHLNENRDGYYYRIRWIKGSSSNGLCPFHFFPGRTFQRTLAHKLLNDQNIDYIEY